MDRWLNSEWFAKIIALLLASMLWMVVNLDPAERNAPDVTQPTYIEGVKITPYYDSERFEIVKPVQNVRVTVENTSPFFRFNSFNADQYEVFIDAKGLGKGAHRVPVQYKGFPPGSVVLISPSMVEMVLEEKQTVEKEVTVELLGQVAPGYTKGQALAQPFRVHVRVPESQVKHVGVVRATVNLEGATTEINTTVPLKVYDKAGNEMKKAEVSPLTAEVKVPVTSPFEIVPLKINLTNEPPAGYSLASIETSVEEVTVYGPQDVIRGISTYPGPAIDLAKITSEQLLQVKLPLLRKVVKVEPEFLEVKLRVAPTQTKLLTNVPLRVSGLAEDVVAKILTREGAEVTTLDFEVIGATENLEGLSADDVQIVADVSNLPVGVHEIDVVYNLPNFIKAAPSAFKRVTIEITNKQS